MKCHIEVVDEDVIIHVFEARCCSPNSSVQKGAGDRDDETTLEKLPRLAKKKNPMVIFSHTYVELMMCRLGH